MEALLKSEKSVSNQIANALLEYDTGKGVKDLNSLPFSKKDYKDVLLETINDVKAGSTFFYSLHSKMQSHDLASDDRILIPYDNVQHIKCVKLIMEDLDSIAGYNIKGKKEKDQGTKTLMDKIKEALKILKK